MAPDKQDPSVAHIPGNIIKATPVGNPLGRVGHYKMLLLNRRERFHNSKDKKDSSERIIGAASVATGLRVKDPLNFANNFFCFRPQSDYSYL